MGYTREEDIYSKRGKAFRCTFKDFQSILRECEFISMNFWFESKYYSLVNKNLYSTEEVKMISFLNDFISTLYI